MRSMWSGTVAFGMVSVPVKLYKGIEDEREDGLRMACACHQQRVKAPKRCAVTDKALEPTEIVKGVDVGDYRDTDGNLQHRFIAMTDADLAGLPLRTIHAIEIEAFVPVAEVPFDTNAKCVYYLEPAPKLGEKAYALLRSALEQSETLAVGRVAMREREQLCAVGVRNNTLILTTLAWPEQVRKADELRIPDTEPGEAESLMALRLVGALEGHWTPEDYRDGYREAFSKLVAAKVAGEPLPVPAAPVKTTDDLMAQLKASVEAARAVKPAQTSPKPQEVIKGRQRAAGRAGRAA